MTPLHGLLGHVESGWEMLLEVVTAPPTWLALVVIGIGPAGLAGPRAPDWAVKRGLSGLARAAEASFGFEAINRGVVHAVQTGAEALRVTQTGLLNWNVLGLVAGLVVVLFVLILGG